VVVNPATEENPDSPRIPEARSQRLPAARRRDQLLDIALDLFGAADYHATSMDDIAEAAGVTKPVLYQHFPSKKGLYLRLLETVGMELTASVTASASATTPHQQVLAGFRGYFRFIAQRPNAFRLLFGSGARRLDEFTDAIAAVEDDLAAIIATYIDAALEAEHREMLGYAIVGLAEVTGRHWASRQETTSGGTAVPLDPEEGERLAHWLADLAWAGLRSLPPALPDRGQRLPATHEDRKTAHEDRDQRPPTTPAPRTT
jgi:AcrR family transcriptional regulator